MYHVLAQIRLQKDPTDRWVNILAFGAGTIHQLEILIERLIRADVM